MKKLILIQSPVKAICIVMCVAAMLSACQGNGKTGGDDEDAAISAQTPVTVTSVGDSTMSNYTTLNATSSFLQ